MPYHGFLGCDLQIQQGENFSNPNSDSIRLANGDNRYLSNNYTVVYSEGLLKRFGL